MLSRKIGSEVLTRVLPAVVSFHQVVRDSCCVVQLTQKQHNEDGMPPRVEQLEDLWRLLLLCRCARLAKDLEVDHVQSHQTKRQAAARAAPDCQLIACEAGSSRSDSQHDEEGTDADKPPEHGIRRCYVDVFLGGHWGQLNVHVRTDGLSDINSIGGRAFAMTQNWFQKDTKPEVMVEGERRGALTVLESNVPKLAAYWRAKVDDAGVQSR